MTFDLSNFKTSVCVNAIYSNLYDKITSIRQQLSAVQQPTFICLKQCLQMGSKAEKKVIIVGKYCVGKTALINRFTKNKFDELSPYHPVRKFNTCI